MASERARYFHYITSRWRKSSIFFQKNLGYTHPHAQNLSLTQKMLDFPQNLITDSKLKITCKKRTLHAPFHAFFSVQSAKCKVQSATQALFLTLMLTDGGRFDILLSWLGYTNHFQESPQSFLSSLRLPFNFNF